MTLLEISKKQNELIQKEGVVYACNQCENAICTKVFSKEIIEEEKVEFGKFEPFLKCTITGDEDCAWAPVE
jgi:hypothetical protein